MLNRLKIRKIWDLYRCGKSRWAISVTIPCKWETANKYCSMLDEKVETLEKLDFPSRKSDPLREDLKAILHGIAQEIKLNAST
jgi:hypothetical protein